ncbi:MAG: hypothetical protein A2W03_18195 [Candidatus Aminicenantes bacterium RBG_16_63_16]|nr:MAG: hypothetical protein A2W03_18195 [Candidatus Aminicenantes bacterium RBG_16_63_16]
MKKALIFSLAGLLVAAPALAGVAKKSKTNVAFQKFGTFSVTSTSKVTPDMQWTNSVSEFKGKGLTGGLIGKTLLRPGDTGQIIDLPASSVATLDNKKKEYTVAPIKKLSEEIEEAKKEAKTEPEAKEEPPSTIKVTKNEFKVEDTGEESTINNFACHKYIVLWLTEWEDTQTGEKGSSRLETAVWTTPISDTLREAQAEEMKFSKAYLAKIGVDMEPAQRDMLGTSWLTMLDAFGRPGAKPKQDYSKTAAEIQKIQGYPIVIDGRYDVKGTKPQAAAGTETAEGEEESSKDVKGAIGGFLKKSLKKKPADTAPKADEPTLTYRIETLEISTPSLSAADFQVPAGYKKKG